MPPRYDKAETRIQSVISHITENPNTKIKVVSR